MTPEEQQKLVKDQLNELFNHDVSFEVIGFNPKTNRVILEIEVYDCDGDWTILPY